MIHRNFQILFIFVGIFVAFTITKILAHVATDWLWFENLGYASAYKTMAFTRFGSFLGFGLLFLALATVNILIARRLGHRTRDIPLEALVSDSPPGGMMKLLRQRVGWIVALGGASCVMGIGGTFAWTSILRFLNPSFFGLTDPIFGNEVGWYVLCDCPTL